MKGSVENKELYTLVCLGGKYLQLLRAARDDENKSGRRRVRSVVKGANVAIHSPTATKTLAHPARLLTDRLHFLLFTVNKCDDGNKDLNIQW